MNRHSILVKLNILFAVALLATLIAGGSIIMHIMKKDYMDMFFKSRLIMQEYRTMKTDPSKLLEEFNFTKVRGQEKKKIIKHGKHRERIFQRKKSSIITYKGTMYLHVNTPKFDLLLRDNRTFFQRFLFPLLVFFSIIVLLIVMYILLRKSLTPLKKLQKNIVKYGEGELDHYEFSPKKDEISLASNAFYHSVEKVKRLRDSRQLFIRNLFHELNTPVTKGKILAEIVEESKTQEMLDSIFTRLSTLLKELAKVEKITSESYSISVKPVRIIELIDEASDLLYLDDKIKTNVTNEMIEADFSSMSIVFKNLIDNALKYGKNLKIIYEDNILSFISDGEALKGDFSSYTEAFFKPKESYSEKGFGLGLYIVNEIIHKHKMNFYYDHQNGKNRFTIDFKNNL